jgi:hypothetical protein
MELEDHMVILFSFSETADMFFTVAVPFPILPAMGYEGPNFFTFLINTYSLSFPFNYCLTIWWEVVAFCGFDLHLPNNK